MYANTVHVCGDLRSRYAGDSGVPTYQDFILSSILYRIARHATKQPWHVLREGIKKKGASYCSGQRENEAMKQFHVIVFRTMNIATERQHQLSNEGIKNDELDWKEPTRLTFAQGIRTTLNPALLQSMGSSHPPAVYNFTRAASLSSLLQNRRMSPYFPLYLEET